MKKFLFPAAVLAAALFLPACDCKEDEKELADLAVTAADFADDVSAVEVGDAVDAIVRIFNLLSGDCTKDAAENKHHVAMYHRDTNETEFEWVANIPYSVPRLAPDQGFDDQPEMTFNVPGDYYFVDIVDPDNVVPERNDNNNDRTSAQQACAGCRTTPFRTITVQSTPEFEARVQRGERIPYVTPAPRPNLLDAEVKYYQ